MFGKDTESRALLNIQEAFNTCVCPGAVTRWPVLICGADPWGDVHWPDPRG